MENYRPFFRFPELSYVLPAWLPVLAVLASLMAGLAGVVTVAPARSASHTRGRACVQLRPPRSAGISAGMAERNRSGQNGRCAASWTPMRT